jgi:electron transfer flavoprotein alpha subunit
MNMKYSNETWLFAEHRGGKLARVSQELLGKGVELSGRLGGELVSVLVGNGVEELASELLWHGADKVYVVDDPRLEHYQNQAYATVIADLVKEHRPEIFLLGATAIGEDLAPCIAAKVGTGLTAHCVDLRIEDCDGAPILHQTVPGWGGGKRVDIICPHKRPQMATVKPGVFAVPRHRRQAEGKILKVSPQLHDRHFRARTVEVKKEEPCGLPLEEAEVVVAAGWGANSLGSLDLVHELSDLLRGVVAGTRPLLDKGLITEDRMIGQSGKVVGPNLFISLGASGAMHFSTGFERAKFVLAVDQNPHAPIFQVSDIGIVGDLREILPCLIEEFKKLNKPVWTHLAWRPG